VWPAEGVTPMLEDATGQPPLLTRILLFLERRYSLRTLRSLRFLRLYRTWHLHLRCQSWCQCWGLRSTEN
jgi:hypothetical protein